LVAAHHRLSQKRLLGAVETGDLPTVHSKQIRLQAEAKHGAFHGEKRRLQNVDSINLGWLCKSYGKRPGAPADGLRQLHSTGLRQKLRIPQTVNRALIIQYHGRCHHGTRQRPTPGFIDPGHNGSPIDKG
jgi:hypothetical protein